VQAPLEVCSLRLSEVRLKETPLPQTVRYALTVVHSNDIS